MTKLSNNPKISVIVPIYMIEKYLGFCIESILLQSYKNLEVILVDDGSQDRCPSLCDLYANKDNRIKVIHKKNGGLVSARKIGVEESTGDLVAYVDGDDWIESNYIENLFNAMYDTNSDMVCSGFTRDLFEQSVKFSNNLPIGVYSEHKLNDLYSKMISLEPYYRHGISTYVWNKLFKKDIVYDIQHNVDDRISIGEDAMVSYPAMINSKVITISNIYGYHYRQREDSMLKSKLDYNKEFDNIKYLYDDMIKWSKKYEQYNLDSQIIDYILSLAIIRSGGIISNKNESVFDKPFYKKNIVVYSAGTFGQQLINRIKEYNYCNIVAWVDDDFWEYRRCCLDVDPIESIKNLNYDYILIASVDSRYVNVLKDKMNDMGIDLNKISTLSIPSNKKFLLDSFLN